MILSVQRKSDGAFIVTQTDAQVLHFSDKMENRHRRQVEEWIQAGNKTLPADRPPVPPTDAERTEQKMTADPFARAVVAGLAEMRGTTVQQTKDWLKGKLS